jgi:hypothetical protein
LEDVLEVYDRPYDTRRPVVCFDETFIDQLNAHGPWSLYEAFGPDEARRVADRLEIHYPSTARG